MAELKDFRAKISAEADCVLETISRASGRDRSEIAREVLHNWALGKINELSLLQQLLANEGLAGEYQGVRGIGSGVAGKVREK